MSTGPDGFDSRQKRFGPSSPNDASVLCLPAPAADEIPTFADGRLSPTGFVSDRSIQSLCRQVSNWRTTTYVIFAF